MCDFHIYVREMRVIFTYIREMHMIFTCICEMRVIFTYTGCPRRKGPNFGRVFLRSNYIDITQNTYIQSSMVTEISAREV